MNKYSICLPCARHASVIYVNKYSICLPCARHASVIYVNKYSICLPCARHASVIYVNKYSICLPCARHASVIYVNKYSICLPCARHESFNWCANGYFHEWKWLKFFCFSRDHSIYDWKCLHEKISLSYAVVIWTHVQKYTLKSLVGITW